MTRRPLGRPVPAEGENGTYSQSWYPLCLSRELDETPVVEVAFLGGRVAVSRDARGAECAGFPVVERYGIVWAFHGEEPLFDVPELSEELTLRHTVLDEAPVDPWLVAAQTMDVQHFLLQHKFTLEDGVDPNDAVTATAHSMGYPLRLTTPDGSRLDVRVGIHGTNIFRQTGTLDGRWFCWLTALRSVRPGVSRPYFVLGARRGEGGADAAADAAFLDRAAGVMMGMLADDAPVLLSLHFRPGLLTRSDRALARYLEYVRTYPRAAPSYVR